MQQDKNGKKRINKIFDRQVFWMILSVVAAVLIWVFYTTNYGGEETKTFYDVEVSYVGESAMRDSLGLVITYEDTTTVNVTVTGPRRYILNLTSADLTATVDLSKVNRQGDKTLNYTVTFPSDIDSSAMTVSGKRPEYVSITVSKLTTKLVEVRGEFIGTVAEGYAADSMTFEPSYVTVTGPEEELAEISYAHVTIDREDLSSSITAESIFTLRNAEDEDMEFANVQCEESTVYATLPVSMTKEVALTVTLINGGGATEENVITRIEPETITLAGDSATLAGVNSLSVATIDLSDYSSYPETEHTIVLPNDTDNLSGVSTALVNLEFTGLATSIFTVSNLDYANCPEGYTASIMLKNMVVTIRAPEDVIGQISANNIRAVADLSGITVPSKVPATIYVDGFPEAGAVGDYTLWVEVLEANTQ